jgi:hypothetical protein
MLKFAMEFSFVSISGDLVYENLRSDRILAAFVGARAPFSVEDHFDPCQNAHAGSIGAGEIGIFEDDAANAAVVLHDQHTGNGVELAPE